mmetsp:Transcript_5896/g.21129  ORF Transcript_5896/g.21129 Transcript_5896/m.21129 type:complete len:228 (+) Transcript_5896:176-859(+)
MMSSSLLFTWTLFVTIAVAFWYFLPKRQYLVWATAASGTFSMIWAIAGCCKKAATSGFSMQNRCGFPFHFGPDVTLEIRASAMLCKFPFHVNDNSDTPTKWFQGILRWTEAACLPTVVQSGLHHEQRPETRSSRASPMRSSNRHMKSSSPYGSPRSLAALHAASEHSSRRSLNAGAPRLAWSCSRKSVVMRFDPAKTSAQDNVARRRQLNPLPKLLVGLVIERWSSG